MGGGLSKPPTPAVLYSTPGSPNIDGCGGRAKPKDAQAVLDAQLDLEEELQAQK